MELVILQTVEGLRAFDLKTMQRNIAPVGVR
jgi:hypothetical protein